MTTNSTARDSGWNVSLCFVLLSPLLGILVGFLALTVFCR